MLKNKTVKKKSFLCRLARWVGHFLQSLSFLTHFNFCGFHHYYNYDYHKGSFLDIVNSYVIQFQNSNWCFIWNKVINGYDYAHQRCANFWDCCPLQGPPICIVRYRTLFLTLGLTCKQALIIGAWVRIFFFSRKNMGPSSSNVSRWEVFMGPGTDIINAKPRLISNLPASGKTHVMQR